MPTITINIPNINYSYLDEDNLFQSVITETTYDYIEKREDLETRKLLLNNRYFFDINTKLDEKLGKL